MAGRALASFLVLSTLKFLHAQDRCGGVLTASFGYIRSPGYPGSYSNNEFCLWRFQYPGSVFVHFISFSSEFCCDVLTITNGSSYREEYKGVDVPSGHFLNSNVEIKFTSDGSVTMDGFLLEYYYVPQLTFSIEPRFSFLSVVNSTFVMKNATVAFFCLATGSPDPVVYWEKDGRRLSLSSNLTNGELRIENAQENDTSVYTCIAENFLGVQRHSFFVAVHVSPVIINSPTDVHLESYVRYQYVYFRCDAYGIPNPEIHWIKDGEFLPHPVYVWRTIRWLRVQLTSRSSFGNYSCYANNSAGAAESATAQLSYRWDSDALSVYSQRYFGAFSNNWVFANSTARIRIYCRLLNFKRSRTVSHGIISDVLKDGLQWNASSYSTATFDDDCERGGYLWFAPTASADSGIYRFDLDIQLRYTSRYALSLFSSLQIKILPAPVINVKFIYADANRHLILMCSDMESRPHSTFTWYHDSEKIVEIANWSYTIFHYHRRSYLLVKNLTVFIREKYHQINFSCQATSQESGDTKTASALVQIPYWYWPWSTPSTPGQCSVSCGGNPGFRVSRRKCLDRSSSCVGPVSQVESCYSSTFNCPLPTTSQTKNSSFENVTAVSETPTPRLNMTGSNSTAVTRDISDISYISAVTTDLVSKSSTASVPASVPLTFVVQTSSDVVLSFAAKVGLTLGGIFAVVCIIVIIVWCTRRKNRQPSTAESPPRSDNTYLAAPSSTAPENRAPGDPAVVQSVVFRKKSEKAETRGAVRYKPNPASETGSRIYAEIDVVVPKAETEEITSSPVYANFKGN